MPSPSDIKAGGAYIEIGADLKQLDKGLKEASKKMKAWGDSITSLGKKMLGVGLAMQGMITVAAQQFAKYGGEINRLAEITGMSTEFLSKMDYVMKLNDADVTDLVTAYRKLSSAMSEMGTNKKVRELFEKGLGINIEELLKLKPEDQLMKIFAALGNIDDNYRRAAMAQDIFGRSALRLMPFIRDGVKAFDALSKEAEMFGLILTPEMTNNAHELERMWIRMKSAMLGLAVTVGNIVSPRIEKILTVIANLIARVKNYISENPQMVESFQKLAMVLTGAGAGLVAIGLAIKGVGMLLSPGGLLFAGIATLIYFSGAIGDNIKRFKEWVGSIQVGSTTVGGIFSTIASMWSDIVPVFRWVGRVIMATFDTLWKYVKAGFNEMIHYLLDMMSKFMYSLSDAMMQGGWLSRQMGESFNYIAATLSKQARNVYPATKTARVEAMAAEDVLMEYLDVLSTETGIAVDSIKDKIIKMFEDVGLMKPFYRGVPGQAGPMEKGVLAPAGVKTTETAFGTFSGAVAGMIAGGPRMVKEQLDELKEANRHLSSIESKIGEGGLAP